MSICSDLRQLDDLRRDIKTTTHLHEMADLKGLDYVIRQAREMFVEPMDIDDLEYHLLRIYPQQPMVQHLCDTIAPCLRAFTQESSDAWRRVSQCIALEHQPSAKALEDHLWDDRTCSFWSMELHQVPFGC